MDAFTDVEVNLSGEAARSVGPAAAGLIANGHAVEVSHGYCRVHLHERCAAPGPSYAFAPNMQQEL